MSDAGSYRRDPATRVWRSASYEGIDYSDGDAVEYRLLAALRQSLDVSADSEELRLNVVDWPSEYHLSPTRHNLLRPFAFGPGDSILELGCGCGGISRYLGETGAKVIAVEGSSRRAAIAAERCRDLPNVQVYCDNLAGFESSERFDVVTLIGVLEYAPLFIPGDDPVRACLAKARSLLAEGGTLILAIENQLGLKYFAGCEEDHTGQPLFGLHSLYAAGTAVTFGRQGLRGRLQAAGLGSLEFYYPFPDYKLPSMLLSEAALAHPDLRVADLLARAVDGKRSGGCRTFHENLAWQAIARNGLVADLANSFLVLARPDGTAAARPDWLAVSYSTDRRSRFWTETVIREEERGLQVRKRRLRDLYPEVGSEVPFYHRPDNSRYVQGELWVAGLWRMLVAGDASVAELGVWLRPWLELLRAHAVAGGNPAGLDFQLPGEFIDCTPFNLIHAEDDALVYIDSEWAAAGLIPASWVVVRGLLYSLYGYPVPAGHGSREAGEFVADLLAAAGLALSPSAWEQVCQLENAFQSFCNERSRLFRFEDFLRRPLGELGPALVSPGAYQKLAGELAAAQRALEAARADQEGRGSLARLAAVPKRWAATFGRGAARTSRMAGTAARVLRAFVRRENRLEVLLAAWRVAWGEGLPGLRRSLKRFTNLNVSYERWLAIQDTLTASDREAILSHIPVLPWRPLISVLMPTYNTPEVWLRRAIESVRAQHYPHWELCIADDASTAPHVAAVLAEYARMDERIRVVPREKNGHISAASNSALAIARGEFVALLDHDDELPVHALYMVAVALNEKPHLDLIYSDEDKIDENGQRFDPYFKPDWNPELFTAQNIVNHLGIYRTETVRAAGGFREGFEGSQDWDLALRVSERIPVSHIHHIPHVLYHWRAIPGSTAMGCDEKAYATNAAMAALREHLERTGCNGVVSQAAGGYFRIRYPVPSPAPLVSIVIPTRNGLHLLRRCIDSIRGKTRYPRYEILVVDNQSDDPEALSYLDTLSTIEGTRVLRYDAPFNYSAINNFAVARAEGDVLCLLNNDIEVISEDWLDEMVGHAVRPGIGAVGAMLYYPDDTIQHAGVVLGPGGVAGHLYCGSRRGEHGYMGRAALVQSLSAVTAACLVVRKALFQEVRGLDTEHLSVAFNDVDFCLRLRECGYRNVWTPYAELYHYESASRGLEDTPEKQERFRSEATYMRARWGSLLDHDPAYNPNLTLQGNWPFLVQPSRAERPWRR